MSIFSGYGDSQKQDYDYLAASSAVSDQAMKNWMDEFKKYDKNNNGSIELEELAFIFFSQGIYHSKDEMEKIIAEFDTNGNGIIDKDEYLELVKAHLHKVHFNTDFIDAF